MTWENVSGILLSKKIEGYKIICIAWFHFRIMEKNTWRQIYIYLYVQIFMHTYTYILTGRIFSKILMRYF